MSDHSYAHQKAFATVRSRLRAEQRSLGIWYLSLYALVLVSLLLVNALVVLDAGTQDHQALQNEKRTLSAVLNARLASLASDTADNAVWTEAYQHIVVRFDRNWMIANYNDSFYKSLHADHLLLLNPAGQPIQALDEGLPASPRMTATLLSNAGLRTLVMRARSMRPDPSTATSGFLIINNQLNLAGASPVAPNDADSAPRISPGGFVFVLTMIVDDRFLASIPNDYGLQGVHLVSAVEPPTAPSHFGRLWDGLYGLWEPAIMVVGPPGSDARIAIAWRAQRPGDLFMSVFLPPVLLVSVLVAVFGVVAIRHIQSNTRQLSLAYAAAAAGSDTKSRFLAMMSHELRTPLNSVIGFADIMVNELFGPLGHEKYREYAAHVHGSGTHLLAIVNDVLDLSALSGGELELHEQTFDLNDTVVAAVKLLTPVAERAQLTLEVKRDRDQLLLVGDEARISQILLNLLSNAIKFTPDGGHIQVATSIDTEQRCVVTVNDTGIGLAAADVPRALELFGQIDNDLSRRYEGTGLGLPLANLLVLRHGGRLDISGVPGLGTRVTVIFPAARVVPAAPAMLEDVFLGTSH